MRSLLFDSAWGTLAMGVTVGCLVLTATVVALARTRTAWLRGRLEPYGGAQSAGGAASAAAWRPELERFLRRSERAFGQTTTSQRLAALIERSGSTLTPSRLLQFSASAALAAFALAGLVAGVAFAFVAGFVGLVAPPVFVWRRGRVRMRALESQLPDVLMTMAGSLKVGLTFDQSMQAIVDQGVAPANEEFARVLRETRLGRPVEESLESLAVRSGSPDLKYVLTAVTIQRELGGSLAELFQTVSDTVRSRQQFRRRVKALTATGRLSAMLLIGLPFACAAIITAISPGYLAPLFTNPTGRVLVVALFVMMAAGAYLLQRIVTIEE
jgi:tight adherence protein B